MLTQRNEGKLDEKTLNDMYRLRHTIFHDRLGWEVGSDNGMEYDQFDEINPVYVVVRDDTSNVIGCWRLLPTTGPYMLKDVFPELLHGRPAPQQPDIWELSRFAVAAHDGDAGFGLSQIPLKMIQVAFRFAQKKSIKRYVSVTSVAIERMFRKAGIHVTRLGDPIRIGRVLTVADTMEIDEHTEFALFGALTEHTAREAA
ncbi:MAG: GNAT family N-acetyltransferase [Gammaproteobacteria bacterium]|nr:GNAT family N-acetyltransferase [Gammaproteobacteria bacterium]